MYQCTVLLQTLKFPTFCVKGQSKVLSEPGCFVITIKQSQKASKQANKTKQNKTKMKQKKQNKKHKHCSRSSCKDHFMLAQLCTNLNFECRRRTTPSLGQIELDSPIYWCNCIVFFIRCGNGTFAMHIIVHNSL